MVPVVSAVFLDVDFTLIHPGPAFQGSGYSECCARHGVEVSAEAFGRAVAEASPPLDAAPAVNRGRD